MAKSDAHSSGVQATGNCPRGRCSDASSANENPNSVAKTDDHSASATARRMEVRSQSSIASGSSCFTVASLIEKGAFSEELPQSLNKYK